MTEMQIVEKSAHARSIQNAPPYISRAPYYFQNPTFFTYDQWRLVAKEPICRLCIRQALRDMGALEWEITSDDPQRDEAQIRYYTKVLENADDGEGWDAWLSRTLQDALELPIGGFAEPVPDDITGLLGGLYSVDAGTIYPTYDPNIPFVQVDPYDTTHRVWFGRGEFIRLVLQPRTDVRRRPFQESPVESAFVGIEALSRMYIYYMKQLTDTPMAGILDMMDMSQEEAMDWAVGFRELFDGVDPLKIPLLYEHTKPARFIPFGRSPTDLQIVELFKRFAELVVSAFGYSIGDLRLFEHERTLAGVEASQRVTAQSGKGYYAQTIEDLINRTILFTSESGLKFKFKLGMTGELQAEAALNVQRAQYLMTLTGNQPLLKPIDAQKQMVNWKMVDVKLSGLPQPPGLPGLEMFDTQTGMDSIDQDADEIGSLVEEQTSPLDTIDQVSEEMTSKSLVIRRKGRAQAVDLAKALKSRTKLDYIVVPSNGWWHILPK